MSNAESLAVDPLETRIDSMRLREQTPVVRIWEPPAVVASKAGPVAIPIERELIATIEQPLRAGETHRVGNDRKEREAAALLAQLTPVQSLALSQRLAVNAANDPLVIALGRMVIDRRNRLVSFLNHRRMRSR